MQVLFDWGMHQPRQGRREEISSGQALAVFARRGNVWWILYAREHSVSSPGLTERCDCKRPLNLQLLSHHPHLLFPAPALRKTPVSCAFQALQVYAPCAFLYHCAPSLSLSFHNSSIWVWLTTHRLYTPSVGSGFQQISPHCLNFTGRQGENE